MAIKIELDILMGFLILWYIEYILGLIIIIWWPYLVFLISWIMLGFYLRIVDLRFWKIYLRFYGKTFIYFSFILFSGWWLYFLFRLENLEYIALQIWSSTISGLTFPLPIRGQFEAILIAAYSTSLIHEPGLPKKL